MKRTLAVAAAAAVAGGVVAFSLGAYASSDNPSGTPSPSSTASAPKAAVERTLLHGERVVRDVNGKIITVDAQRGSVTAVSASSLTVKSADATTWTWTLSNDTKVRDAKLKSTSASTIKVGDSVVVIGPRTGDTRTARLIADPPPNHTGLRNDLRKLRRDLRNLRLH
jgi:ABC-type transport system substrate-binding protein